LGTRLGQATYAQGFPAQAGQVPFYEHRDSGSQTLKSYYNAVSRKEYERAYSYFQGAPNPPATTTPPYAQFVQGYADTVSVDLAVGKETQDAGAGNVYAAVPVVLIAHHTNGTTQRFAGCYVLHRTQPGIDPNPQNWLWHIVSGSLAVAPGSPDLDPLLARPCGR
jgi:hypothetical protein